MPDQPTDPRVAFRRGALDAIRYNLIDSPAVGVGDARRYMLADAMWPVAEPLLAAAYDRGLAQGLMHAVEHVSRLLGHEVVLDISREVAEGMLASALDTAREQGRREAAAAVRAADTSGWPGGRQGEVDACQEIAANIAGGTDAA